MRRGGGADRGTAQSRLSAVADALALLAVPNVSEGRNHDVIEAIGAGFHPARLLDVHADEDHHRSVFTLAVARRPSCRRRCLAGRGRRSPASTSRRHDGLHPRVGAWT